MTYNFQETESIPIFTVLRKKAYFLRPFWPSLRLPFRHSLGDSLICRLILLGMALSYAWHSWLKQFFSVTYKEYFSYAPVAQLDRVTDFESVGCRFEPCRAHQPN